MMLRNALLLEYIVV